MIMTQIHTKIKVKNQLVQEVGKVVGSYTCTSPTLQGTCFIVTGWQQCSGNTAKAGDINCEGQLEADCILAILELYIIISSLHTTLIFGRCYSTIILDFLHSFTNKQQQRLFNGLWSGTTRVGLYQKEHSPTHTHPDHRASFIIFLHLQRQFTKAKVTLWSVDLIEGSNCWNMLWKS